MNILLLGGTGTLSTTVRNLAIEKGHSITIFNRGNSNIGVSNNVKIIIGDFYNIQSLEENFTNLRFDVVVDFLSRKPQDIERVYAFFSNRCKQYIFISSACVYRRAPEDFPLVESCPKPNMDWSYNIEKYKCEETLIRLCKNTTSYYTIVRPYITYDEKRIPIGIAPEYRYHRTIIERIKNNKPMFVWDGGNTLTTLTSVVDFSVGIVGLFLNEKARNQDFHITTNKTVTHKDVLIILYKLLGKSVNIVDIPSTTISKVLRNYRPMLVGDRQLPAVFDNSKIIDAVPELSFSISLEEGLIKVLEYYENKQEEEYDYMYEGQIDRLMSEVGISTKYISYGDNNIRNLITYSLFRYLPYRFAIRIRKMINI